MTYRSYGPWTEDWERKRDGTAVGKTEWSDHLIDTLRLRYDALTTGELRLYQELMEQRGIEVPPWFRSIRAAVDAGRDLPPVSYLLPETVKLGDATVPDDPWAGYDFVPGTCDRCHTETLVDRHKTRGFDGIKLCAPCQELHDLQRVSGPAIERYDQLRAATELHPLRALRGLTAHAVSGVVHLWPVWFVLLWVTAILTVAYVNR